MTHAVDPFKIIEQGIKVFPVDPGDKRPVARDPANHPVVTTTTKIARISWSKDMTTDRAKVERWIEQYPGCKWGTPTGDVNGFIAVDIDTDEASDWWDEKWFPEASDVHTPRGGRHVRYSVPEGLNIQTNKSEIFDGIDVRAEGGYIVAYTDDYSGIPEASEDVLDLLPRKKVYQAPEPSVRNEYAVTAEDLPAEKPSEVSLPEQRVLKGITDRLDALPRPWHDGAGYHKVQFETACHLWRIVNNTRDYATTEEDAYALFVKHAPLRDGQERESAVLRDERWASARQHASGQIADPPGETPIRLEVTDELLSKYSDSEVDRLFWESKKIGDVKKLIRALRLNGADEQVAYSISYDSAVMKRLRKEGNGSTSTWGFVKSEFEEEVPEKPEAIDEDWSSPPAKVKPSGREGIPLPLLTEDERTLVRHYPNYIDNYIDAAKYLYSKPNLPLHYVNAWISLSVGIGDKASIFLENGRVPLSLWGLNLAPSAAGKSDANRHMHNAVNAMRAGGIGSVDLGDDVSAQSLIENIMDRPGKATGVFMDECREFLLQSKRLGSYQNLAMGTFLKLYDGELVRGLRKGMEKDQVGERAETSFTLWMQGAWKRVIDILDETDIESGFVGRFLVAIGGDAEVTRDSLTPKFANQYQVKNDGRHPIVDAFAAPVGAMAARLEDELNQVYIADEKVLKRYVDMRESLEDYASKHRLAEYLRGVLLRVGLNILKGAGLLAISEGRNIIEHEDLLLAMKSGEYWLKGSIELAEAISASQYRRLVDYVVDLVRSKPRTGSALLRAPKLQNMKKFEVDEIIERAEKEGRIVRSGNTWEVNE